MEKKEIKKPTPIPGDKDLKGSGIKVTCGGKSASLPSPEDIRTEEA